MVYLATNCDFYKSRTDRSLAPSKARYACPAGYGRKRI